MNGLTPFANGGCQSLLQSTRMGSHPLLMVDVKVYYSHKVQSALSTNHLVFKAKYFDNRSIARGKHDVSLKHMDTIN